ncbi:hypothetical protein F7P83_03665 [Brevibacterium luteolum]|nr:hypothetical protein [Brevibacterium luteolum]
MCTDGRKLLDDGHVDLKMRQADTGIEMKLHDDTGIHTSGKPTEHPISDIAFGVRDSGMGKRGPDQADPAFDFLGKQGDTYYALPFVQKRGLLWPGYNTQEIDYSKLKGPVSLSLTDAKTPKGAHFALAEQGSGFGGKPEVRLQSGTDKTSFPIDFATHAHPMWVFTKPGAYELTFQASATGANGSTLTGEKQTLHVHVGKAAIDSCLGTGSETETPSPKPTEEPTGKPTSTADPSDSPKATDEPTADASGTATETSGPGGDGSDREDSDRAGSGGSGSDGEAKAGGSADGDALGALPRTGGSLMAFGLALPLLGAGGALLLAARRRRR